MTRPLEKDIAFFSRLNPAQSVCIREKAQLQDLMKTHHQNWRQCRKAQGIDDTRFMAPAQGLRAAFTNYDEEENYQNSPEDEESYQNYPEEEEGYRNYGYQNYEEEDYRNYSRNNPFAMLSLVVFYLVIVIAIYAFAYKKSYLTPANMGIAIVLLLITGGSAMS